MTEIQPESEAAPRSDAEEPKAGPKLSEAGTFVVGKVSQLQTGYHDNSPAAVAQLARLRRVAGRPVGSDLGVLDIVLGGYPREDKALPETPTDGEQAVHAALTLFALHQQSKRSVKMHQGGYGVGRSARLLADRDNGRSWDAVRRHFELVGMARSWESLRTYARSLVQQLRAAEIPLDYGKLTDDLIALRNPARADAVRNRWGRDFYYSRPSTPTTPADDTGTAATTERETA